jgi:hypothetical protein
MRCCFVLVWLASAALGATYHVDSKSGDDQGPGSKARPWKSLDKVNAAKLAPGDRVLFRAGSTWAGQLAPASSGSEGAAIVFGSYGSGKMPRIDAGGKFEDAVLLKNVQWIEVRDLEVTNTGPSPGARRGVHVWLDNFGTAKHIIVSGLFVHDVNGTHQRKDNGGIIFRTNGNRTPSRFDGLTIERNVVWKVERSAIAAQSYHYPRTRWFPSLNVVIRDNFVSDIGGDGIVPWATDGALIEHNIARNCNQTGTTYNAGIWPWSTDNSLFQLNEASWTRTTLDGQGFDSDYNSRGTTFQFNYSHDNEGGFMLICSPGKRNQAENLGNIGTIVRRNVSRNDRSRIFHLSAAEDTLVHDNAIYVGAGHDVQMLITTDWEGWARGAVFRNNWFYSRGTARYGHAVSRHKDGTYGLAPGWGPARDILFEGNRYYGKHVDAPKDARGVFEESVNEPKIDWNAPQFDAARGQDGFDRFLRDHRAWMIRMLEKQFGEPVKLGR